MIDAPSVPVQSIICCLDDDSCRFRAETNKPVLCFSNFILLLMGFSQGLIDSLKRTGWLWKLRYIGRTSHRFSTWCDVDWHNIVCSWCAQAHVSIHSCDFTDGYFQGQEADRILLYRIPEEGVTSGAILAPRVPVYDTKGARAEAMNSVLQKFLVGKEEHKSKG